MEDNGKPATIKMRMDPTAVVEDEEYDKPLLRKKGFWEYRLKLGQQDLNQKLKNLGIKNKDQIKGMSKEAISSEYARVARAFAKDFQESRKELEQLAAFQRQDLEQTFNYLKNCSRTEIREKILRAKGISEVLPITVVERNNRLTSYKLNAEERDETGRLISARSVVACPHPDHFQGVQFHSYGVSMGFIDRHLNTFDEPQIYRKKARKESRREYDQQQYQKRESKRRWRNYNQNRNNDQPPAQKDGEYSRRSYDRDYPENNNQQPGPSRSNY